MSLLVAGLTGSGKTSATRLAARTLGYQWISGSKLRQMRPGAAEPDDLSDDKSRKCNRQPGLNSAECRIQSPASFDVATEKAFDTALSRMAMSTSDAVFDVWFIPWIMPSGGPPAIFLEARFETRLDRVCGRMKHADKEYVAQLLEAKDAHARTVAEQCYGIDIFTDRTPFEEIVATDCLSIGEVTRRICMHAEDDQRHIPSKRS